MPYTMQQVVDRARIPLNDAKDSGGSEVNCRVKDADLLGYANGGIRRLKLTRPDLFFGQFEAMPGDAALVGAFPIADEYFEAVADYVTARAETGDDEATLATRATMFFNLFTGFEGAG